MLNHAAPPPFIINGKPLFCVKGYNMDSSWRRFHHQSPKQKKQNKICCRGMKKKSIEHRKRDEKEESPIPKTTRPETESFPSLPFFADVI